MSLFTRRRSLRFSIFVFLFHLFQLISGLPDSSASSSSKNGTNAASSSPSKIPIGLTILLSFLGLLAVVAFSVFLFKIWQKKKREEQQARLLKLFEEDDELEVELGIRD